MTDNTPTAREAPVTASVAIRAVRWTLIGSVAQRLITFACVAVVARVLGESEYGVYRQLLAVHVVIYVLLPLGFDQLYIRETKFRPQLLILLTGALCFASAAVAVAALAGHGLWVRWLNFGPWSGMLWVFPAVVALQAGKLVYKTELAAQLDYRTISIGETLYSLVSGVGGVLLVLAWHSAWGLYVSYGCAEVAELMWLCRRTNVKIPPISSCFSMLRREGLDWKRFSIFYCGTQFLNALGGNAPVIILGAALSKAAAAAFSIASFLVTVPIFILIGALHRVAFSALAGRSREQLVQPVTQMLGLAGAFIVPVLLWVALLAEPLVGIFLGGSWVESTAPVARLLSLYCIFAALFSPVSSLDVLLDRPDYGFYWNVVATTIRVAAVVLGLHYGVMHAVAAYAVCSAVLWIVWGAMLANLLGAGQMVFHRAWLRLAPLWVFLGLMLFGTASIMTGSWAALFASIVPAMIYVGLITRFYPDLTQQGLRLIRRRK